MTDVVVPSWNYHVVLLSYILSAFGSWTTLLLIEHACVVEGREKVVAFLGSSLSMGICAIWSMHFTGMLALDLGLPRHYNIVWACGSAIIAVVFCGVGIWKTISLTVARRRNVKSVSAAVTLKQLLSSGIWTGFGVALMHYMEMKSMVMEGLTMHVDHPIMALLSVLLAVGAATAAFCILLYSSTATEQIIAALIMGAAVCGMHYIGMAACSYKRVAQEGTFPSLALGYLDDKTLALITALVTCGLCFVMLGGLTIRIRDSKQLLFSLVRERTSDLAEQQARADALLYSLLPRHIAEVLKSGDLPPNRTFDDASVLFVDIVGFTPLCSRSSPQQIVDLLNRVFQAYDTLILRYGLSKIDMVGDCLIVASGVPVPSDDHVIRIVDFALDAIEALTTIDLSDQETNQVCARVGICSGPLATGVVGLLMPHYSLFGDTVNVAARMEQASFAGKIHYTGRPEHIETLKNHFHLTKRATIEVKGKENFSLDTFWVDGRKVDHKPVVLDPLALFDEENRSLVGLRRRISHCSSTWFHC
jgi:NO-binding membrane sensor protein with MHYT domain/class 3 adenylate cyclase